MGQDERDFILQSASRIEGWESTPRAFDDPYSDMTSEEKSKLLMMQASMLEDRKRENERLMEEIRSLKDIIAESNQNLSSNLKEFHSEIAQLRKENKDQNNLILELTAKNKALSEQLSRSNKNLYGSKSQKGISKKSKDNKSKEQDKDDFDGTPDSTSVTETERLVENGQNPKTRTPAQLTADMRRNGSTYKLMTADSKIFHKTDLGLLPPGAQVIRIIDKFAYEQKTSIIEHNYQEVVYKLGDKIITAYLPAEGEPEYIDSIPGTHASSDMLAHLAFNRFVLDTPLYREVDRLKALGMRISRKTLSNWLHKGSTLLSPVVDYLKRIALEKDSIINCDETWCRVKVYDKYKRRYIWCLVNRLAKIVIYCYEDGSRSRQALKDILGGAELKALQSDGYNVYLYIDRQLDSIDHICCMAHARAKFKYALEAGNEEGCRYILQCISELYALEKTYATAGLTSEQIGEARRSPASLEIIGRLRSKLDALKQQENPQRSELFQKAINYLDTFWVQIFRYTEDGNYLIDNNIAERFIRPLAGERKNSLFFGSHKMARASAIYHTVFATCRMMGYSAMDYLRAFFRKLVNGIRDYSLLMPDTIGISMNKC